MLLYIVFCHVSNLFDEICVIQRPIIIVHPRTIFLYSAIQI